MSLAVFTASRTSVGRSAAASGAIVADIGERRCIKDSGLIKFVLLFL
jgi:hypothetical protein